MYNNDTLSIPSHTVRHSAAILTAFEDVLNGSDDEQHEVSTLAKELILAIKRNGGGSLSEGELSWARSLFTKLRHSFEQPMDYSDIEPQSIDMDSPD